MGKQRSIGCHIDDIGIALEICHESSLKDAGLVVVPLLALAVTSVLTSKHLRTLAVVALVAQTTTLVAVLGLCFWSTQEPCLWTVEVLIDEVGLLLRHSSPALVEHLTLRVGTTGTDNLDIGILGANGCHKRLQTLVIKIVPLFVADADILHVEGLGVSHLSANLTPLRVCRTVGELNQIEAVLDIGLQLVVWYVGILCLPVLELAGHTDIEYGQWLSTDILRELEELKEAEAVALEIIRVETVGEGVFPTILVEWAVLYWSNGVFPLVAGS